MHHHGDIVSLVIGLTITTGTWLYALKTRQIKPQVIGDPITPDNYPIVFWTMIAVITAVTAYFWFLLFGYFMGRPL